MGTAEAGLAILFLQFVRLELESTLYLKILVIIFYMVLGLYFIVKEESPALEEEHRGWSHYLRGLTIAGLNLRAILFWIFLLTFLWTNQLILPEANNLIYFLAGIMAGKFLTLINFIMLSDYLEFWLKKVGSLVNKSIVTRLLLTGLFQAYKFFMMG